MRVKLRVLVGKSVGKEIEVPVARFLIGRSDECHLRPKSDSISRNHCAIMTQEDRVVIRDLNSRNGTFVNGERVVDETELKDGDKIQVGKLDFQIVLLADSEKVSVRNDSDGSAEKTTAEANKTVSVAKKSSTSERSKSDNSKTVAIATAEDNQIEPAVAAASGTDAGQRNDDSSQEFDVSAWLEEADKVEHARRRTDPDTRQFKLDEADRAKLEAAEAPANSDSGESAKPKTPPDKKQPPGKLPTRDNSSTSSREAAAEMLKKYFRR